MKFEDLNMFNMEFKVVETGATGRLAKTCTGSVLVDIGGLTGLEFCDNEEFEFFLSIPLEDMKAGAVFMLDGTLVEVLSLETETLEEFNQFWEDVEMREMA